MRNSQITKHWFVLGLAVIVTAASVGCSTGRFFSGRRASRGGGMWYPGKSVASRWSGDREGATASLASRDSAAPVRPSASEVPRPSATASAASVPSSTNSMPAQPASWSGENYNNTGNYGDYATTGQDVNSYDRGQSAQGSQPQNGFYNSKYQDNSQGGSDQYASGGNRFESTQGYNDPYGQAPSNNTQGGYQHTADLRGSDQYGAQPSGNNYQSQSGGYNDSYNGGGNYGSTNDSYNSGGSYNTTNGASQGYNNTGSSPANYGGSSQYDSSPAGGSNYGGAYDAAPAGSASSQPYTPGSSRTATDQRLAPPTNNTYGTY